jgi:hypothetical protein
MLVTSIIFIGIVSVMLGGMATYAASHSMKAEVDSDWVKALDIAEAGVNTELSKISRGLAADLTPTSYSYGGGSYTVWVTQRDANGVESTPWATPNPLVIYSKGTFDGVSRTVRVTARGISAGHEYAIYATGPGVSTGMGSSPVVVGDVGANGLMTFTASPQIQGEIYFNGPEAGWGSGLKGDYEIYYEPRPMEYETVQQVAGRMFPSGGFTWLKSHNDNSRATPAILNNTITGSTILRAGNYYVERLSLTGQNTITFDNTLGPINLWIGPEGGTNASTFQGGSAAVAVSNDPDKRCAIYVATRGEFNMDGNTVCDALVYAHNKDAAGNAYGEVVIRGNPTIHGQIIAGKVDFRGQCTVIYKDLVDPLTPSHYGFDGSWQEGRVDANDQWTAGSR